MGSRGIRGSKGVRESEGVMGSKGVAAPSVRALALVITTRIIE